MRVILGRGCVCGVVGSVCWLLPWPRPVCVVESKLLGWSAVERDSRVDGWQHVWVWMVSPSSAGLVESRVNLPRPLGKPEYVLVTDSVVVP